LNLTTEFAMRRLMNHSTRMIAFFTAVEAFAGAPALAQVPIEQKQKLMVCIKDSCIVDTTRVFRVRLLNEMDSLQRVYFGRGLMSQDRRAVESQISEVIAQLVELQRQGASFQIQIGNDMPGQGTATMSRAVAGPLGAQRMLELEKKMDAVMPRGWIGISPMGPGISRVDTTGLIVRYLTYPSIESVDPDSPAEHAGVARGDVLVAFNGEDVTTTELAMTRLLQPDHKLTVRVRRGGVDHDYAMMVVPAPESFLRRQSDFMTVAPPPAAAGHGIMFARDSAAPARMSQGGGAFVGGGTVKPVARGTSPAMFGSFDPDVAPVAGARMSTNDEDLGHALGVTSGVLVLSPASGSIAAQAGLRGGDIIVKAGGKVVEAVRDLRRQMETAGADRMLELQIIRDRKSRTVVLKW
jgi:S1-C subfamily serine protease